MSSVTARIERVLNDRKGYHATAVTNLQQSCFWAVDGIIRSQLTAWAAVAAEAALDKKNAPSIPPTAGMPSPR